MGPSRCRSWTEVAFECVTAIEELADILADIVLNHELAAWVIVKIVAHIKNYFIE